MAFKIIARIFFIIIIFFMASIWETNILYKKGNYNFFSSSIFYNLFDRTIKNCCHKKFTQLLVEEEEKMHTFFVKHYLIDEKKNDEKSIHVSMVILIIENRKKREFFGFVKKCTKNSSKNFISLLGFMKTRKTRVYPISCWNRKKKANTFECKTINLNTGNVWWWRKMMRKIKMMQSI